ncbi:hypothetical protein ACHAWF_002842 [Thalassiosira exigua]
MPSKMAEIEKAAGTRVAKRLRRILLVPMCLSIAQVLFGQYSLLRLLDGYHHVVPEETDTPDWIKPRGGDDNRERILDDFDMSSRANCGDHKCFFPSKTNASIGYLVAANTGFSHDMSKQWKKTKRLEAKYNIRHFLSEPPQQVNITRQFTKRLNKMSISRNKKYVAESPVFVQKSAAFPERAIHFGCEKSLLTNGMSNILHGRFAESIEVDAFLNQLRKEFAQIADMLEKEPWAAPDLQFVFNTKGEVYITDLGWFVEKVGRGTKKKTWLWAQLSNQSFQEEWKGKCHKVFNGLLRGFAASWNTTASKKVRDKNSRT